MSDNWIGKDRLMKIMELREKAMVLEDGGVEGIMNKLHTCPDGLSGDGGDVEFRQTKYGKNEMLKPATKPFLMLWLEAFNDITLIILIVLAIISLVIAFVVEHGKELSWLDGVAILATVIVVTLVSSINTWSQERQFQKLNERQKDREILVVRAGQPTKISVFNLVVGDILTVLTGDVLPCDGLVVQAHEISCDEAPMTGESELIKKTSDDNAFMLCGCKVQTGNGKMLVTAVGMDTQFGVLKRAVITAAQERTQTPLQEKLDKLAKLIGYVGFFAAGLVLILLIVFWIIPLAKNKNVWEGGAYIKELIDYFIIAVTIIVMAVPEGLPLAVTISLAYSMRKMLADSNLVRRLASCETMGGATTICSDKTGTLTMNKMKVTAGYYNNVFALTFSEGDKGKARDKLAAAATDRQEGYLKVHTYSVLAAYPSQYIALFAEAVALNSTGDIRPTENMPTGAYDYLGNVTECAMLLFLKEQGIDYKVIRGRYDALLAQSFPFSSEKKRMTNIYRTKESNQYIQYTKGASEIVTGLCTSFVSSDPNPYATCSSSSSSFPSTTSFASLVSRTATPVATSASTSSLSAPAPDPTSVSTSAPALVPPTTPTVLAAATAFSAPHPRYAHTLAQLAVPKKKTAAAFIAVAMPSPSSAAPPQGVFTSTTIKNTTGRGHISQDYSNETPREAGEIETETVPLTTTKTKNNKAKAAKAKASAKAKATKAKAKAKTKAVLQIEGEEDAIAHDDLVEMMENAEKEKDNTHNKKGKKGKKGGGGGDINNNSKKASGEEEPLMSTPAVIPHGFNTPYSASPSAVAPSPFSSSPENSLTPVLGSSTSGSRMTANPIQAGGPGTGSKRKNSRRVIPATSTSPAFSSMQHVSSSSAVATPAVKHLSTAPASASNSASNASSSLRSASIMLPPSTGRETGTKTGTGTGGAAASSLPAAFVHPLTPEKRTEIEHYINQLASNGLRTIAVAYKNLDPPGANANPAEPYSDTAVDNNLTLVAIVGIKDPLRPEVPPAIGDCHDAHIVVRMVTGDNIDTAMNIAKECGIYNPKNGIAMEGVVFRNLPDGERMRILPKLQVLARSSPIDKQILVGGLQSLHHVVAVTGDGTNDAPALSKADVGFAMGITGTEVAKDAAAIILTDDNFASIVKAVMWGRNVYDGIRKFLQFQLTVNFSAICVSCVGAVFAITPLKAVPMLWVNLIMDTLAALALATEVPTSGLLKRKPCGRDDPIICASMWRNIIGGTIYEVVMIMLQLFLWGPNITDQNNPIYGGCVLPSSRTYYADVSRVIFPKGLCRSFLIDEKVSIFSFRHFSLIFNTFIWMQMFNLIASRKCYNELNFFENLLNNTMFYVIWIIIAGLQVIIMLVPGIRDVFSIIPISGIMWAVSLGMSVFIIPFKFLLHLLCHFGDPFAGTPPIPQDEGVPAGVYKAGEPPPTGCNLESLLNPAPDILDQITAGAPGPRDEEVVMEAAIRWKMLAIIRRKKNKAKENFLPSKNTPKKDKN